MDAEPLAIDQLALEGGEEALAPGVVISVADAANKGRAPARRHRLPKVTEVYWQPWSE
jgi:hypothetical protein